MSRGSKVGGTKRRVLDIVGFAAIVVLFLLYMVPFILVLLNSFKQKCDIIKNPFSFITEKGYTLANYTKAFEKMEFVKAFGNSLFITGLSTLLVIIFASMVAYYFTRAKNTFSRVFFALMAASMIIPFQAIMIPLVSIYGSGLHMLNHRLTLIFMHTGFAMSMSVFIYQERYPAFTGGGGRFDAGMLYYTPQIWCSDNTDAVERIKIQYGTSFAYPSCTVGSHVSAVPNHQTGRMTELATRAAAAMAGSFGYELDLNLLTEEEKEQVREQIKNYHRFEMLIRQGRYYRLTDVWQKKEYAAWEYCAPDESEALVTVITMDTQCNPATEYVKLRGLGEDKKYRVEVVGIQTDGENVQRINGTPNAVEPEYFTGAQLVYAGLPVPRLGNKYKSWQVYVKEV